MRLTKYTHACVRLEHDGRALVIDPGVFSEREAYDGVSAVLITHEHADHLNVEVLPGVLEQDPTLKIYTNAAVAAQLAELGEAVVTVSPGDTFDAAGMTVQAVGGEHAEIYEGLPGITNTGYVVAGEVYHPGDALFVPPDTITTLLVPISAPWLKTSEMLDFLRAVSPHRAIPIHDVPLSDVGRSLVDGWAQRFGQTSYERVAIGSTVEV